jgi:hypothetical protein
MDIIRQTTQITYSPQHLLLIMSIGILIEQLKPVRWTHNRPADETRVLQMATTISKAFFGKQLVSNTKYESRPFYGYFGRNI